MVMLLSLGSKKIHVMNWNRRSEGESRLVKARTVTMRHLMWKVRSQWRLFMKSRQSRMRFGYDPESYSQNFDDKSVILACCE